MCTQPWRDPVGSHCLKCHKQTDDVELCISPVYRRLAVAKFSKCPMAPAPMTLETSDFVHGSAMWSFSLVMSECSLSGRGQGRVSYFSIVDLENFATASRRYTGDIHNSSVVGLFMTTIGQWKRLDRVMIECTCLLHLSLIHIWRCRRRG